MKTKRIVSITLACVLLATAVITGIALFVTNNKPVVADKDNVLDSNLVASIDAPGKVKLIQTPLRAASSNADSFVLTASVDSTDSDLNAIEWSTEFANPSSAWATGKKVSDYVTITVDGSDPNKVTVKNTAPFGEVINVVAKAKYFDVSAKCKLDYIKRIEDATVSFVNKAHGGQSIYLNEKNQLTWTIVPTYGVGTVQGEVTYKKTYFDVDVETIVQDEVNFSVSLSPDDDFEWCISDFEAEVFNIDSIFAEGIAATRRKLAVNDLLKYIFGYSSSKGLLYTDVLSDEQAFFFVPNCIFEYKYNGANVGKTDYMYACSEAYTLYRNGVNLYSEITNITLGESGYAF